MIYTRIPLWGKAWLMFGRARLGSKEGLGQQLKTVSEAMEGEDDCLKKDA